MSKKHPSAVERKNLAYWGTPEGRKYQDYCCQHDMPAGAIKADLSQQAPHNSYGPPMWYADCAVQCRDCGRSFVWTARAQQRWYEVLKRPIYTEAVRCAACSRKVRAAKHTQKTHMAEMARKKPKKR